LSFRCVAKKVQVPVLGGLRKVIIPASSNDAAIATLQAQVAQLAAAITALQPAPNTQGGGASGAILLGPGLAGGGSIVGNVPINLVQPPQLLQDFDDSEPYIPLQGPQGIQGPAGAPGTGGTGVPMLLPDFDEPESGIPLLGVMGPAGPVGPTGPAGSGGGSITLIEENYSDEQAILPVLGAAGYVPGTVQVEQSAGWASIAALIVSQTVPQDIVIPFNCTLRQVLVMTQGPQSAGTPTVVAGSLVITLLHSSFAGFPASLTDMTGGNPPTITASSSPYNNTTFSGWTVLNLLQGDVIRVSLQSVSLFAQAKLIMRLY
jgi:hypothetical protein